MTDIEQWREFKLDLGFTFIEENQGDSDTESDPVEAEEFMQKYKKTRGCDCPFFFVNEIIEMVYFGI